MVVGIGNEFRRDDGAGPYLIRAYKDVFEAAGADVVVEENETLRLMQLWKESRAAFLIDAVRSNDKPGTVYRFDALKEKIPEEWFSLSTHQIGMTRLIELSRILKGLPEQLIIYGIAGKDFGFGRGISAVVRSAAQRVARRISKDVERFCKGE